MTNVVIAGYARSPFTLAKKGALARVRSGRHGGGQVIREPDRKDRCRAAGYRGHHRGLRLPRRRAGHECRRIIGLLADLPISVGGHDGEPFLRQLDESVHIAAGAIAMGAGEVFICAGIESMSRIPIGGYNPLFNLALTRSSPAPIWAWARRRRTSRASGRSRVTSRKISQSPATRRPRRRRRKASSDAEIVAIREGRRGG